LSRQRSIRGILLVGLIVLGQIPGARAREGDEIAMGEAAPVLRLPDRLENYANPPLPRHFRGGPVRRFDNARENNPVTDAGATLGRVLFYDTQLSANNKLSCATCHQQSHAFSDPRKFSKGHDGREGDRHAMPLVNLRYEPSGRFFWDERAKSLEDQVLMPIQNKVEMGQTLEVLAAKLGGDKQYAPLFTKAFGDTRVNNQRIASALAQFVRSLVSYRSKFDGGVARAASPRADFPNFDAHENHGKTLFLRNCAVCHFPPGQAAIFSQIAPTNNGLDQADALKDFGVGDITFKRTDVGRFKSPSLRNVEFTAPYMHDGRFKTLEEVIDHYSTGIKNHPNLDPRLRGPRGRLNFTSEEKADLVAFLKTLSDPKFLKDPRFSDPFKRVDPKLAKVAARSSR
jgi:cytochrome c peroxidase